MSGIAYWPGDTNPAQFQSLQYSPSTNTLTLSPFGNSVVINPVTQTVSTINASTINTSNIFVNITNSSTINSFITNATTINTSTINSSTIISQVGNFSTLNVSSINGFTPPAQVQSWINPATPINVSSLANSVTPVPVVSFSTIQGRAYNVSFEYGSSNLGGGAATDQTAIAIAVNGGHITIADTFITDQTYFNRYNNTAAIIVGGTGGNATINVVNDAAAGNSQNLNFFRLYSQDLGTFNANY